MTIKSEFLEIPSKTLNSSLSFLALMKLQIWSITKTLKIYVKCL